MLNKCDHNLHIHSWHVVYVVNVVHVVNVVYVVNVVFCSELSVCGEHSVCSERSACSERSTFTYVNVDHIHTTTNYISMCFLPFS